MPITLKELMPIMKFLSVWNMLCVLMKPLFLKSISNFLQYQSRHGRKKSAEEDSINGSLVSSFCQRKYLKIMAALRGQRPMPIMQQTFSCFEHCNITYQKKNILSTAGRILKISILSFICLNHYHLLSIIHMKETWKKVVWCVYSPEFYSHSLTS